MNEKIPPELFSIQEFLFEAPLYEIFSASNKVLETFYSGINRDNPPIDGHCPYCGRASTFVINRIHVPIAEHRENISLRSVPNEEISIICARSRAHLIRYFFRKYKFTVEKIGQHPSLADIANDEVAQYRKNMAKIDAHEFHKAIGLAAHGVGVGSFVYLRRVFERLITTRFEEFKGAEGWKNKQFYAVRMEEKISLLDGHLPEYLVKNRKIYSILSVGVHELDERECLKWFEVMKQSILIILDDDKKKKEELERRAIFSQAIESFEGR